MRSPIGRIDTGRRPQFGRRGLELHLALVFGVIILSSVGAIAWYIDRQAGRMLTDATHSLFDRVSREITLEIEQNFGTASVLLDQIRVERDITAGADDMALARRFSRALEDAPFATALYAGYPDGSLVLMRRFTSEAGRRSLDAPVSANLGFEVTTRQPDGRVMAHFTFFDASLNLIATREQADFQYDPRERDWFIEAHSARGIIQTQPYRFFATQEYGITLARQAPGQWGEAGSPIIAVDLTLDDLARALAALRSTPGMVIAVSDDQQHLLAASDPALIEAADETGDQRFPPWLAQIASAAGPSVATLRALDGRDWETRRTSLERRHQRYDLLIAAPRDEILTEARGLLVGLGWLAAGLALAAGVLVWLTARVVSGPLVHLAREAETIRDFRFESTPILASSVREIDTLAQAIGAAKLTIGRFLEIGTALAAEPDVTRLLHRVLAETVDLVDADGGIVYLAAETGTGFKPDGFRWRDRNLDAADLPELQPGRSPAEDALITSFRQHQTSLHDTSTDRALLTALGVAGRLDFGAGRRTALICIPLLSRSQETIGALLLFRAEAGRAEGDPQWIDLARAVSGNAAIAIETRLLLKAHKDLLDAMIRMVAQAIDAKSPYTSGHCQRVPVLTRMLAEAACAATEGPYENFTLDTRDWEAIDVASWLHDCGKLTTTEYVIDKSTKLETIYDRIHEIRLRFEVKKCQAETEFWQGLAEGGDRMVLQARLSAGWAELDDDFAFVAACNEGGEYMAPDRLDRLRRIAGQTWRRTLDDRAGISAAERSRKPPASADLPALENLLADRPEHLIPHHDSALRRAELDGGFTLKTGAWRLNLGELYNLSVARGTLTEEERYEINRHISQTIVMLESLPFPATLGDVPALAGGHHEKMDGSGYPRGLKAGDMPPVARMMAIADVFEALTAADRPYKKAKKMSEVMRIMGQMKQGHHLDPDLLDLFVTTRVWERYAERFLDPAQRDEPDISAFMTIRPA